MKVFFSSALLLLLLVSCELERTISVEIPFHEPAISTNSFLSDSDTISSIFVATTVSLSDSFPTNALDEAEVLVMREQTGESLRFEYDTVSRKYLKVIEDFFFSGEIYTLEIQSQDLPKVFSQQVFPDTIVGLDVDFIYRGGSQINATPNDILDLSFNKNADSDYYLLQFSRIVFDTIVETIIPEEFDPRLIRLGFKTPFRGFLIDSQFFDGETNKITFDHRFALDLNEELNITLSHISEEYFNFLNSLRRFEISENNNFVEPVRVNYNIENGYGNFAIASKRTITIEL